MEVLGTTLQGPTLSPGAASTGPGAGLDAQAFMLLLLAELRNQNPLEPVKENEMVSQAAQLNTVQELQQIRALLEGVAREDRLAQAAALIGRRVQARAPDGGLVEGRVLGVTLQGDQVMLRLEAGEVPLEAVTAVLEEVVDAG